MIPIRSMVAALALAAPALAAPQGTQEAPKAEAPKAAATPKAEKPKAEAPKGAGAPKADAALSSAARDLARAPTTQESWDAILDGYAASLAGQISGALAATGKEAPADLREKVRTDLHDAVRYEQAVEMQARALSGRFSEDELRALETFYRAGPGKKLLAELPEIARQVNDELRARLSERVPRIVQQHAPSVAESAPGGSPPPEGGRSGKAQGRSPPSGGATPPRR